MHVDEIIDFLKAVDADLSSHANHGETLDLYLLGRSALILGFGLTLMTKDVDIIYVHGSALQERALRAFGKGTSGARRHGFYLETVPPGLPLFRSATRPGAPKSRDRGSSSVRSSRRFTTWP